jgi:hypothetical protein
MKLFFNKPLGHFYGRALTYENACTLTAVTTAIATLKCVKYIFGLCAAIHAAHNPKIYFVREKRHISAIEFKQSLKNANFVCREQWNKGRNIQKHSILGLPSSDSEVIQL